MTLLAPPSPEGLSELRNAGRLVGYNGFGIYLRYRTILQMLRGKEASRILIVGCGHGIFDRLLPPELELVGVDIDKSAIETARSWAAEHRPRSSYVHGRVEDLDLQPGWADLSIASEVIEHVPADHVQSLLTRMRELTRSDGTAVITVPNVEQLRNRARRLVGLPPVFMDPDHDREYTLAKATTEIETAGYTIEAVRGAVLFGPLERHVTRILPAESPVRNRIAWRWPTIASHLVFRCRP